MQPDDTFVQQVREVLDHLYDYAYLQAHPLTNQLPEAERLAPRDRMRALRSAFLQAIEELHPGNGVPFRAAHARTYSVLKLHFVEGMMVEEVARELGVSDRQVYRDLRKAEQDLATLLWFHFQPTTTTAEPTSRGALVRNELQRLSSEPETICLQTLLDGAIAAVTRLGEQRRVRIHTNLPEEPLAIETDRLLARQVLVNALSHALQSAKPDTIVSLTIDRLPDGAAIDVRYARSQAEGPEAAAVAAEQLVKRLGGSWLLETERSGVTRLRFTLGGRPQTMVLVIDDNAGLVELFRRYLAEQGYQLLAACNGVEGLRLAQENQPQIIVLDVMMPQNDGWEVLQWLRHHEATRHIPVIVCSVLDDPQLAISLGAAGFLAKPVKRAHLLAALEGCLRDTRAG